MIFELKRRVLFLGFIFVSLLLVFSYLFYNLQSNNQIMNKQYFLNNIFIASPALVTAGRNIAYESSNALSNAPASYLNLLDCCENDEAITSRMATGQTTCKVIKKTDD